MFLIGSFVQSAGIIAGKFLERDRIVKMKISDSAPPLYYLAEDLSVGCKVVFLQHQFIIIDADEYALSYMEKHKEQVRS